MFKADDHSGWYGPERKNGDFETRTEEEKNSPGDEDIEAVPEVPAEDPDHEKSIRQHRPLEEAGKEWKKIAEKIQDDLETFSREQGDASGALIRNLREVTRERYDYALFLKKFAVYGETLTVNDDEFDYIYYNYGLQHYHRMPLIEPLEYRENSRIRDFVIAIDTSGSVAGEEVQTFLQKTYNILKSRESFHNRINVHIIQCDAQIQSDEVISSAEDFDRYLETMEIRGLGGTDFRPVFDYVDRLLKEGEFSDLKGLIYFTDGLGIYPSSKPAYKTAFVFVESGYNVPDVPVWAMKLVLRPDEL